MLFIGLLSTSLLSWFGYDALVTHYGEVTYILKLSWVRTVPPPGSPALRFERHLILSFLCRCSRPWLR